MKLLELQQNFRQWLTVEAPDAAAQFGESAAPGLAVYLNNYRGQLMACLAESFEVTHAWMGDASFSAAAATHIDERPPHSWTLDDYAIDFPETLARLFGDDPEIFELAALERALDVAFVGPDAPLLDTAGLAEIDWDTARLGIAPTLIVLRNTTNVAAIWAAISEQEMPPAAEALERPADIAVWRQSMRSTFRSLEPIEYAALELARSDRTFAQICAMICDAVGPDEGPAVAGALLAQWIADQIVVTVHPA